MANILGQNRIKYQIDNLGTISEEPEIHSNNAPVTRIMWQCNNLPPGLTLSPEGKISGRPTTTGSYACTVAVTTNWGSTMKIINIKVTE